MTNRPDISFLRSPRDRSPLSYLNDTALVDGAGNRFPVINGIPRFVEPENYADSFGLQWNLFSRTQIDKFNGTTITRDRFVASTGWNLEDLPRQRVLEVGCGAGRFTQVVLDAGAEVYSIDYSNAVEANLRNNGPNECMHLYQASVYALPFPENYFDKIFCLGVLQHTPDVRMSFMSMIPFLKKGGEIVVDVYPKKWSTYLLQPYYWYRPVTKRMSKDALLKIIRRVVPLWLPASSLLLRLPRGGHFLSHLIPVANYTVTFPQLTRQQLVEWAVLDTFDNLSPEYDQPQTMKTLQSWMKEAGLEIHRCELGGVGFLGVGRKP